jgi:hypothetical protein
MKISILFLFLLLVVCFCIPIILKTIEGIDPLVVTKNEYGEITDVNYSAQDTTYTPKTTKLDPSVEVVDPDQDIITPVSATRDFSNSPSTDFDKWIKHSTIINYDASRNQAASYTAHAPVYSPNFEAGYYLNKSSPSLTATTGVSTDTIRSYSDYSNSYLDTVLSSSTPTSSTSTSSTPSPSTPPTLPRSMVEHIQGLDPSDYVKDMTTMSDATAERDIEYNLTILQKLSQFFRYNNETFKNKENFASRRVQDISDNQYYDISANYELYNERGQLKKGIHDSTNYAAWFDSLGKQYENLYKKYKRETKPIKCIADFATDVGDELCCGQEGVLQNTKYVCPDTLPTCSNFECGSQFGTCS